MPNYTQGGPAFCSVWLYPQENTQLPSDSVIGSLEWVKYPASTIDWSIRGTTSRSNHDTQPWYVGYLSRPLTCRSLNSWSLYQPGVTKEVLDLLSFIDLRDGWGRKNQTYVVFLASSACWFFFFFILQVNDWKLSSAASLELWRNVGGVRNEKRKIDTLPFIFPLPRKVLASPFFSPLNINFRLPR